MARVTGSRLVLAAGSMLDVDHEELIAHAAAAGFGGVGLRLTEDEQLDRDRLAALARRAADLGLAVHDVEVHRISAGRTVDDAARLIDAASVLGAPWVLVVSDLGRGEGAGGNETIDELARIVDRASSAGVSIGLEYMAWTAPPDPIGALRMARATGARVVVDVLHHVRVGAGVRELSAIVRSGSLGWLQLCDAPRAAPTGSTAPDDLLHEARHARLPPGDGELPLGELLAVVPAEVAIAVEVQSEHLAATWPPAQRAGTLFEAASRVLTP